PPAGGAGMVGAAGHVQHAGGAAAIADRGIAVDGHGGAVADVKGALAVAPGADHDAAIGDVDRPTAEVVGAGDQASVGVLLVAADVEPAVDLIEGAAGLVDDTVAAVVVTEPGVGGGVDGAAGDVDDTVAALADGEAVGIEDGVVGD